MQNYSIVGSGQQGTFKVRGICWQELKDSWIVCCLYFGVHLVLSLPPR